MAVLVKDKVNGGTIEFSDGIWKALKDEMIGEGENKEKRFVKTDAPAEVGEAKNKKTFILNIDGKNVEMTRDEILVKLRENKITFNKTIGLPKAAAKLQDYLDTTNKALPNTEKE